VKKYFLFILSVICFLLSFAGDHQPATAAAEQDRYSFSSLQYPHTELEIAHNNISVHSNCRQQAFPLFADRASLVLHKDNAKGKFDFDIASFLSHKRYLSHIYPSHNFW
jgi:hypothetical protein